MTSLSSPRPKHRASPSTRHTSRARRVAVLTVAAAAAIGVTAISSPIAATTPGGEVEPNERFDVDTGVTADYLIGNVTAINASPGGGWVAVHGGAYNGTSTVNTIGADVLPNAFIATTDGGELHVRVGGESLRHVVIDAVARLRRNSSTKLLPSPDRITDTRGNNRLTPRSDLRVSLGADNAGDLAIINLTVANMAGPGWQATYPCAEGYQGTSSINLKGGGAQAILNVVKLDAAGDFCIKTSAPVDGVIVDVLGFVESEAEPARRILDTRTAGNPVAGEIEVVVGEPNSVFVGSIVATGSSGPGWVAAYTAAGGYNGTSTVNTDGVNSFANLVIMKTDANGAIHLRAMDGMTTHVVVDGTTVAELAPHLVADARRLVDTRTLPPFVVPACRGILLHLDNGDGIDGRDDRFDCVEL